MFPNWTLWKTAKTVLSILAAAAAGVATQFHGTEIGTDASLFGALDASLIALVVLASGTSAGPMMASNPASLSPQSMRGKS